MTSQEVESFVLVSPCETLAPWFPGRLLESRGTSQRGRWCLCLFLALLEHSWCPRTQQDLLLARPEVLSRMGEGWDSPPRGAWGSGPDSWVRAAGRRWFSNIWSIRALFSNRIYQNKLPRRGCSGPGPPTLRPAPQRREGKPCMSPGGQRGGAILRCPPLPREPPSCPCPEGPAEPRPRLGAGQPGLRVQARGAVQTLYARGRPELFPTSSPARQPWS